MRTYPLSRALSGAAFLTLAGCGGGNGDDPVPPPAPSPITLSGTVMGDQAIQNAVVCLDLNANSACDATEPTSIKTSASGDYSLTYDPATVTAAQAAAASLIARMVPGAVADAATTLDAAKPGEPNTTTAYVLRQVPGKGGQINPLTTLVAAGVAAGMTEAAAHANAAIQLGIAEAKIDNYQDDPATDTNKVQDNARTLARFTADALEHGAVLEVGDQSAAAAARAGDLTSLRYTDADNYFYRTLENMPKAAGAGLVPYRELAVLQANGQPVTTPAALYPQIYLTPAGWKRCVGTDDHSTTQGTPSRGLYCGTLASAVYVLPQDISGQSMTSVIQAMQTEPGTNVVNNGVDPTTLLNGVGTGAFPADSSTRLRVRLNLNQPLFVNDTSTDARPQAEATTLEALIAAKPAAQVNLATAGGSLTLGMSTSALRNLRVAFTGTTGPTAGTVQFYDCDLNAAATVASNCTPTQTGTYAIETVHGARAMRFTGHAPTTFSSQETLYAEVKGTATGDYVFRVREAKPTEAIAASAAKRLNSTAWGALKAQLGL
ncbi:MAG TPA: hypothetical protein VIP31_06995 [Acidovorax sp.]